METAFEKEISLPENPQKFQLLMCHITWPNKISKDNLLHANMYPLNLYYKIYIKILNTKI